nr:cytochrome c oxidase subunit III [Nemalecium lighti]
MISKKNYHGHPYHIVDASPWPYLMGISVLLMVIGIINLMHFNQKATLVIGFLIASIIFSMWIRDMVREATFQGFHTNKVLKSLKLGFILFLVSEVCLFFSLFWAFFHSSLSPSIEIGVLWPPLGIEPLNPFSIPLLNTVILLSSGVSITWAHHSLIKGEKKTSENSLFITILLGVIFTAFQAFEYLEAPFSIADSVYGSTFFLTTGFHGMHVIIGTTFLLITLIRMVNLQLNRTHHFGFEAAAWYWHFVDIVWLFLYIFIYWWGF